MFSEGQKKQVIILGVLLLVLAVIALRKVVFSGSQSDVVTSDEDGTEVSDTPVIASTTLHWQPPDPIPDNFRDPMLLKLSGSKTRGSKTNQPIRIVTQHEGSKGDLVQIEGAAFYLKGIVYSEVNPSSIITDEGLLHVGDVIHGIKVINIATNSVEFQKNQHTYHVRVGEKTSDRENDPNH